MDTTQFNFNLQLTMRFWMLINATKQNEYTYEPREQREVKYRINNKTKKKEATTINAN